MKIRGIQRLNSFVSKLNESEFCKEIKRYYFVLVYIDIKINIIKIRIKEFHLYYMNNIQEEIFVF